MIELIADRQTIELSVHKPMHVHAHMCVHDYLVMIEQKIVNLCIPELLLVLGNL